MSLYRLFVPKQAVGADLVYFDLFVPSASEKRFELLSVLPVVSGAVAVVGVVGVDLLLTRTTAVGTGGTGATFEGTSTTAMTFSAHDSQRPLKTQEISARLTPTGGATAGAVLSWGCVFSEETADATYQRAVDLARPTPDLPPVVILPNSGIRVVQGAVASVGNIGFNVILRESPKP